MTITIIVMTPRRVRRRRPDRKVPPLRPAESHLEALLERVHRKHPGRLWTVAELRERGFVMADDCRRLGTALSSAIRAGGRVGRFVLTRHGRDNTGAVYQVSVATSVSTRGDSAR